MLPFNIAILVNPNAGNHHGIQFALWMDEQLLRKQIQHQVFTDNWPTHFTCFSDIWLIGGDGTINYFINQHPDCSLPLVLYKGGTGNDFACHLYGKSSNKQIFDLVLQADPRKVDAGKVNGKLYINCLGIGFDGEVLRSMGSIRLIGGHLGYLIAVVLTMFRFKEPFLKVVAPGFLKQGHFLLAMITNSPKAGGGFHISPGASVSDGKLDMVLSNALSVLKRFRFLPVIEKGKHYRLSFITHLQDTQFEIHAEQELAVQMDGELFYAKDLLVDVIPGKFLFRY